MQEESRAESRRQRRGPSMPAHRLAESHRQRRGPSMLTGGRGLWAQRRSQSGALWRDVWVGLVSAPRGPFPLHRQHSLHFPGSESRCQLVHSLDPGPSASLNHPIPAPLSRHCSRPSSLGPCAVCRLWLYSGVLCASHLHGTPLTSVFSAFAQPELVPHRPSGHLCSQGLPFRRYSVKVC